MSKAVEIRFPTQEGSAIMKELAKPPIRGCERVIFALAGTSRTSRADIVLVSNPRPVPEDAYFLTDGGSAWSPRFTAEVAAEALRRHLGVLMIHSHPFRDHPRLSIPDEQGLDKALPSLKATVPYAPHGSIVVGIDGSVGGKVWFPGDGTRDVESATWLGSPLKIRLRGQRSQKLSTLYKSQVELIGECSQLSLEGATLGIIGLGGGGSHVVQQASRVGFGNLVLVDHDVVEEKNRSRMVGTTATDVGKLKIVPMRRMVLESSNTIRVDSCDERFPSQTAIGKLKECDLVISCVDTFSTRAEVIKFAWRYLIPLIDIGIGSHTKDTRGTRQIDRLAGHLHVYLPGGPCMWCARLLTTEKIEAETGGRPEYLEGRGGPGQIISFNGVVASLAVIEAMQLVTGALHGESRRHFMQYDGMVPSLMYSDPERDDSCSTCNTELGAGDPVSNTCSSGYGSR